MIIEDVGSGSMAAVNKKNQLLTRAVARSELAAASELGDAFSWTAVSANIAAAATALCVANDSATRILVIDKIYVYADVPTQFQVHFPAAATWAGTAVVGVNLNQTSNKLAPATAKANETGQATQGSLLTVIHNNELTTDEFGEWIELDGSVRLGQNDAIAVDIVADSGAYECTVIGHYVD